MSSEESTERPLLSIDALRRASPQTGVSPTRTLRITEAEHASRDSTPVSSLLLRDRPRSNPRSRTPMRYVSPLDPNEFRRESLEEDEPVLERNEARRISIRPMAGRAVGTVASSRIHEERPATPKSRKQGPSHRKIRRWNNDHFACLANEIAKSSRHGHIAANVLMRAHEDAHLYRDVVDPADLRSKDMTQFMEDEKLKNLRERFFEGEGPLAVPSKGGKQHRRKKGPVTMEEQMDRIDHRLRQVIVKACANSFPATKVVGKFEAFLTESFVSEEDDGWALVGDVQEKGEKGEVTRAGDSCSKDWWKDLLLEPPTVSREDQGTTTAKFYFDAESSTGGFHRLLLHALAQFHGLKAASRVTKVMLDNGTRTQARALTVCGSITGAKPLRLLDHLAKN